MLQFIDMPYNDELLCYSISDLQFINLQVY